MKTYKSTLITLLFGSLLYAQSAVAAPTKAPTAASIIAAAEAKAASENKNVLVMFHASWCVWCHRLDDVLTKPEVAPVIDAHYVTVHIDIEESKDKKDLENSGGDELLDHLGGKGLGIPYYAVLSPTNETLAMSKDANGEGFGYPGGNGVPVFIKMLQTTSHNWSDSDASLLSKGFAEVDAQIGAERDARQKLIKPIQDAMAAHDYKAAISASEELAASHPDMAFGANMMRYKALLHADEGKALAEFGQPMGSIAPKDADGPRATTILYEDSLSDRAYNKALPFILANAARTKTHWIADAVIAHAYSRVHDMKKAMEHQDKAIEEAKEAKASQQAMDRLVKTKQDWQSKGDRA